MTIEELHQGFKLMLERVKREGEFDGRPISPHVMEELEAFAADAGPQPQGEAARLNELVREDAARRRTEEDRVAHGTHPDQRAMAISDKLSAIAAGVPPLPKRAKERNAVQDLGRAFAQEQQRADAER